MKASLLAMPLLSALALAACGDARRAALLGTDQVPDAGEPVTVDAGLDASAEAALPQPRRDAGPDAEVPTPAPVCDPAKGWGTPVELALPGGEAKTLDAVSGDEYTVAWSTGDGTVRVADRTTIPGAFAPAQVLSSVFASGERVALGADGRALYGVRPDGRGLLVLTRPSRDEAFAPGDGSVVANLQGELDAMASDERIADLVVGSSDTALLFRRVGGTSPGLRVALRVMPGDAWSASQPFAVQTELSMVGARARRPTGLSADLRALYFLDESSGVSRVAYFRYDAVTASTFLDTAGQENAQPSRDCATLYFSTAGKVFAAGR
ncbi:MAG: hypothetical protein HOO96_43420 [Polyangiaceae bacterium]|nr:hypothetical protein [Polyangiaceae bacterium]